MQQMVFKAIKIEHGFVAMNLGYEEMGGQLTWTITL